MKKLGVATNGSTDHELHGVAVRLAGRHDDSGRQLNKALDHQHKLAVSQFGKAGSEEAVRALWSAAMRGGDIPGAYWAALTHPAASHALVRDMFGDVHMLSHLVGSANRADIRRLCQLEAGRAALTEKLSRQQAAGLLADQERRLDAEGRRRSALEQRFAATDATLSRERAARKTAERECDALHAEIDALEAALSAHRLNSEPDHISLAGTVVLYVGGRRNHMPRLRDAAERLGADLLHHDGGVESHQTLLPGLVSRSDLVVFPVDCVSHDAVLNVKALCRHAGKRFIPLRSASLASLLAALRPVGHLPSCPAP